MTSVLNYSNNSPCDSNTFIQSLGENASGSTIFNSKDAASFIVQPSCSNISQPSSLLAKRSELVELEDLLVKKIKTQSTNITDTISNQESPQLMKNFSNDTSFSSRSSNAPESSDNPSMLEENSSKEGLQVGNQSIKLEDQEGPLVTSNVGAPPFPSLFDETQCPVVQALEVLKIKMLLDQEVLTLQDTVLQTPLPEESLYIPPLISPSSRLIETTNNNKKTQGGKAFNLKMEDDSEITYGDVEFPFLSISAPLSNIENIQKI